MRARAASRDTLAPSRSQPVVSHMVQVQKPTGPSTMVMETERTLGEPHAVHFVWARVAFMPHGFGIPGSSSAWPGGVIFPGHGGLA